MKARAAAIVTTMIESSKNSKRNNYFQFTIYKNVGSPTTIVYPRITQAV
jgi:hypothetical protein